MLRLGSQEAGLRVWEATVLRLYRAWDTGMNRKTATAEGTSLGSWQNWRELVGVDNPNEWV